MFANVDWCSEDVIIQPSVMSVIDHLKQKNANKLLDLINKAGLIGTVENLKNLTFFVPSEKAISEIPKKVMDELVKDGSKLEEILLHHIASASQGKSNFFISIEKENLTKNFRILSYEWQPAFGNSWRKSTENQPSQTFWTSSVFRHGPVCKNHWKWQQSLWRTCSHNW